MVILDLHIVALVFGLFAVIIGMFYRWSTAYTRQRQYDAKKKIYACGEDIRPADMNIPQESFYSVLVKTMKLEKFRELHSGDLTRYLVWVFTGMVVLMIYLMVLWKLI